MNANREKPLIIPLTAIAYGDHEIEEAIESLRSGNVTMGQ